MARVKKEILTEVVRRVREVVEPRRIILFGSAARGRMTPDSDIDLLVLKKSSRSIRKESVRIGDALRGLGYPFDVIVMDERRFERTKNLIGGIAYPAERYGKVLYQGA